MPQRLFSNVTWFDFSRQRELAAVRRIDTLLDRYASGHTDVESIVELIFSEFSLESTEIGKGQFSELEDVDLGTSQLADPSQWNFPPSVRPPGSAGKSVTFSVPFIGTRDLLSISPTRRTGNPPMASISGSEIRFTYTESLIRASVTDAFKSRSIQDNLVLIQWLKAINNDAEGFNHNLRETTYRRIQTRLEQKNGNQRLLDDLNR